MKLLTSSDPNAENVLEAEFVPDRDGSESARVDPPRKRLTIERSKEYAKEILDGMSAEEALKFLRDQVLTKNLLLNDAILKQLELLENEPNWAVRLSIVQVIQTMTATSTEITQSKLALDKALGMNLLPHLPDTAANPALNKTNREVPADDFMKAYKVATEKPGSAPKV